MINGLGLGFVLGLLLGLGLMVKEKKELKRAWLI
jgi:hypothetical protein